MGVFDKLQAYSSHGKVKKDPFFDTKTPSGAFLQAVHDTGYAMYEKTYHKGDLVLSEEEYMEQTDKSGFTEEVAFTELHDAITTPGNQVINSVAGSGKALNIETRIITPDGALPLHQLKVGDKVIGTDGKAHTVTGYFPQGKKQIYQVSLSNGSVVECCEEHLWNFRIKDQTRVLQTREIADILESAHPHESLVLPAVAPVEFEETTDELPIPPYLVGYLVGGFDFGAFRTLPNDINANFSFIDFEGMSQTEFAAYTSALFSENKFIPQPYKCGSFETRKAILDGIVDKCGSVECESWYRIPVSAERTAKDIVFVAQSLGMFASFELTSNGAVVEIFPSEQYPTLGYETADKPIKVYTGGVTIDGVFKTEEYAEMACISVDSSDHLYLVDGFVPTHNTTAIVLKILYDVVTGEARVKKVLPTGGEVTVVNKMWVCTFLRSGAAELEEALESWQRRLGYTTTSGQIQFSTMDAEFKRCLNAMGVKTNIGEQNKLFGLFRKAVDACNITRDGYPLANEDYKIIEGILTYYRGRLDDEKYNHPNCEDYNISPTTLDYLASQYESLRRTEGIMDFEEVMELLYKYLYTSPNEAVQNFVADRYNFIYIDEFQDTSQMAYAILRFYARGKLWINCDGKTHFEEKGLYTGVETLGKFVCIGDNSQCIYTFRGSDSRILTQYVDDDFRPVLSRLSVNWRCPDNILNPVVPSIHMNQDSASQVIKAAKQGGEIYAMKFVDYKSMLNQLGTDVMKDMDDGLSVAILCRTNYDGMLPAFSLEASRKFNFGVSGENMTLSNTLPRKIIGVSSLFTERSTPNVRAALSLFVPKKAEWQLKVLMDTLKMNNISVWQVPEEDLVYSCPSIIRFVKVIKPKIMPDGHTRDKERDMDGLLETYRFLLSDVFTGDSTYAEGARAYIEALIWLINDEHFATVYDFLETVEEMNDRLHGRVKKKAPIQIATVHEYKGKECDSVYIWNDSEGVFPSTKCDLDNEESVAEERRVHYIACTRARKREHIYTKIGHEGKFLREMSITPQIVSKPSSVSI